MQTALEASTGADRLTRNSHRFGLIRRSNSFLWPAEIVLSSRMFLATSKAAPVVVSGSRDRKT